ncbi:hypothetical protein BGX31_007792 [Mortierella sp. GBA43]|nr:hypothetical protein BGX31_007792 [Mortierella sp. GBA43]
MAQSLTVVSTAKHYGGRVIKYSHQSSSTQCEMVFNVFLPKEATDNNKVPVLYCLGGLTSTEENFVTKSGFGPRAAQYGLALIFPDTSPRNVGFEQAGADSGIGYSAGFYLNATQEPWNKNWKMYDYIAKELPALVAEHLPIGGHGALTIFLKNQDKYKSISAFAPILHPMQSHWGLFAFPQYLGPDTATWEEYDTIKLLERFKGEDNLRADFHVLIDQGTGDEFLNLGRLHTPVLIDTVEKLGLKDQFTIRLQDGYNHGYYFISTFVNDHIDHHAKVLGLTLRA